MVMWREDRVVYWFCRFERVLVRLVIAGAVILVLAQGIMPGSWTIGLLDLSNSDESMPVMTGSADVSPNVSVMTFELLDVSSLSKAKILVNGVPQADLSEKFATVKIMPGDLVEIDGTFYERPFQVKLLDVYPEATRPEKGIVHTVNQDKHRVGILETR